MVSRREMNRIILRSKRNGVFTGMLKKQDALPFERGVFVELDPETGLLLWCPEEQIQELIHIPLEELEEEKRELNHE
jgi:hypothetical protein